jgi:hypothetical protein
VGIGMCIQDADRGYVLAKTTWFALLCSVDVGEVLGLCEALRWVAELGFTLVWTSHWIRNLSIVIIVAKMILEALLIIVDSYLELNLPTLRYNLAGGKQMR